jgi:hypothetical protein
MKLSFFLFCENDPKIENSNGSKWWVSTYWFPCFKKQEYQKESLKNEKQSSIYLFDIFFCDIDLV